MKRLVFFLFCWVAAVAMAPLWSQQAFLNPKKIKNAFQTQLVLNQYSDLLYLESHLPEFQHIETVKVDGTVDIAKAALLCSKLGVIQELQLYQFEGIISDEDLQLLEWVPTVSIYIPKNRVDATVLNASWSLLTSVSLRFEEVPDNFDFLIGWKQLRNLSVLGPINTEEADALIAVIAQHMPRLKYLELSLVGVQNLPPKITQCKQLHGIRIVDGSDWARGLAVEEMGELVVPLRNGNKIIKIGKGVNSVSLEKNVYMPLRWISSRPQLASKELAYLKSLYPDVQEHEALTWLEDTEWEIDFAELEPLQPYPYESVRSPAAFLPGFTDGKHHFLAHTESDQVFIGDREWSLSIPKNALESFDGKPYYGGYHVSVNYLDDPMRAVAAGLSLHYDSNRVRYLLHPAFALEIEVRTANRDKVLRLKTGYLAEVNYALGVHETDRFYAYNSQKSAWMHYYDYDYQFESPGLPVKVDFYQFYKGAETAKIKSDFQSWTLDEAFQTEGFNYLLPPERFEMRLGKYKGHFVVDPPAKEAKEMRRIVRGKNQLGIRALPRNKKANNGIQELFVFDRSHSLFPELAAFEGMNWAFRTQLPYDKVLAFFKEKNWIDIRIRALGNSYFMELKTHRGIWVIQMLKPSDFREGDAKERLQADRDFTQRWTKYEKIRSQKAILWHSLREQAEITERIEQKTALFGAGASNARKKGRFMIASFGVFAMAHPLPEAKAHSDLILCELGKIPLEIKRVALVFEGEPYTLVFPVINRTKQIPVVLETLQFLMAETVKGEIFYLHGTALRNLKITENTLTYVELKPLKEAPQNAADLRKEIGLKAGKKRKKP